MEGDIFWIRIRIRLRTCGDDSNMRPMEGISSNGRITEEKSDLQKEQEVGRFLMKLSIAFHMFVLDNWVRDKEKKSWRACQLGNWGNSHTVENHSLTNSKKSSLHSSSLIVVNKKSLMLE